MLMNYRMEALYGKSRTTKRTNEIPCFIPNSSMTYVLVIQARKNTLQKERKNIKH